MDINSILIAMVSMGGLGVFFAAGLSVANKKLHVEEDPRIAQILDALPGANCGGCGLPGCGKFAESIVDGEIEINGCPVNSSEGVEDFFNTASKKNPFNHIYVRYGIHD